MTRALIALEDGTFFRGRAFAGSGEAYGELVFNTSMSGYQEILSDPSYHGQIVTFTYPMIGNVGTNPEDVESHRPHAAAMVIGEHSRIASNWRKRWALEDYLVENGLMGIDLVDTRAITLHIRSRGAMKCVISTIEQDPETLVRKARRAPGLVGRDLVSQVTCDQPYSWPRPDQAAEFPRADALAVRAFDDQPAAAGGGRIAVLDCGVKLNMLRLPAAYGCEIKVFPAYTPADVILGWKPQGLLLSNGPGDPSAVAAVVSEVKRLVESGLPTFGICFGHQLLGQAFGGRTFKLKFGHRGANQPVKDLRTGRVAITSQNHGFCVDLQSLEDDDVETTHINLNDGTSEGLAHRRLPVFSVQHHPEATPGPHDAASLFAAFMRMVETGRPLTPNRRTDADE